MWHHCQNTDCTVCNSTQSQTVKLLYAQRPVFKTETEDTSLFYQQNSASWLSNYNSLQWKPILKLNLFWRIFLYVLTNSVCERKTTDSERQDRQRDKRERERQTVTENKEASSETHWPPVVWAAGVSGPCSVHALHRTFLQNLKCTMIFGCLFFFLIQLCIMFFVISIFYQWSCL